MAITRGARGPSGGGSSLSDSTPQPLGVAAAGVSTSASRADHVHALPSTAVNLSVSTGWTSSLSGAGSAAAVDTTDQQIELSVPGSLGGFGSATLYRDDTLLDGNADEVRCRIRSAALDNNTNDLISMIFITASDTNPVTLRVRGDSTVLAIDPSAGTAVTVTNILGGQGWLRLVRRGTESVMYAGVGSAGAPPTTWTPIGTSRSTSTTLPPIRRLRFDLVRLVSGTVAAHAHIGDISLRAPL